MNTTIKQILTNNGPDEKDYLYVDGIINEINSEEEKNTFRNLINPILNEQTLVGHSY